MSSAKMRTALGRGIADLIPVGGSDAALDPDTGKPIPPMEISIRELEANPGQPRVHFDPAALQELADSIQQHGILQPILVRPRTVGVGYEIVAGERRFRAAKLAGKKTVPVVVRSLTDSDALAIALIENLIREDIGPLETARAFRRLMDDYGWTQEEMGRRVGKSRVAVTNALRLLRLPEPIQKSLEAGELSEGHARALLGDEKGSGGGATFRERQQKVWRQAVDKRLSVREVERLMRAGVPGAGDATTAATTRPGSGTLNSVSRETASGGQDALTFSGDATTPVTGLPLEELRDLEDRLRAALGTKVELVGDGERGRIVIAYYSGEELDGLLARLEGRPAEGVGEEEGSEATAEEDATPAPRRPRRGSGQMIGGLLSSRLG